MRWMRRRAFSGERITAKSRQRQRRLSEAEEQNLIAYFTERDYRADIPMADIMRFAVATARRQEEITRLQWADLNRERGTTLLRNVKHPRLKTGNHKFFKLPPDAWAIIEQREGSTTSPLVFPYNSKSIGAAFTRAVRVLGIQDLRFHDLRHEATSRLFERGL